MSFFRQDAIERRRDQWLGEVMLASPFPFRFITLGVLIATLLFCIFFWLGQYTEKSTVSGQLVPDKGLIKLFVPRSGVVTRRYVNQGQSVRRGDRLFDISAEQYSQIGATQEGISNKVRNQEEDLRAQRAVIQVLQKNELDNAANKLNDISERLGIIAKAISSQRERVSIAQRDVDRYESLFQRGFVSEEKLDDRKADLLGQQNALQSLEGQRVGLKTEFSAQRSMLSEMGPRGQRNLAQVDHDLASTGEELFESESKRNTLILAPQDGTVTDVMANVGQQVDTTKPLAVIMPAGAILNVELLAPSSAVGFVKSGDSVVIRYRAYPYQIFGEQRGFVESVALTALTKPQLGDSGQSVNLDEGDAYYRIVVRPVSQTIAVHGIRQALRAGMLLDADLLLDRRRLYQWALSPIYTLSNGFR